MRESCWPDAVVSAEPLLLSHQLKMHSDEIKHQNLLWLNAYESKWKVALTNSVVLMIMFLAVNVSILTFLPLPRQRNATVGGICSRCHFDLGLHNSQKFKTSIDTEEIVMTDKSDIAMTKERVCGWSVSKLTFKSRARKWQREKRSGGKESGAARFRPCG